MFLVTAFQLSESMVQMKNQSAVFSLLLQKLLDFRNERDWKQFHQPRNLLLALAGEIGELSSLFQWVRDEDVPKWINDSKNRDRVAEEIADVFAYVLLLADSLEIDLVSALDDKIDSNALKYPVDLSRGNSTKYTNLPKE